MRSLPTLLAHGGAGGETLRLPSGPAEYATSWTAPWPVVTGLLVVGGLYVWGVLRLRRRGASWPPGRTVAFLGLGLGALVVALMSGFGAYDDTLFSSHMAQHMLLTMVAPVFLALGAPVTLALRTLPSRPRGWLLAVLGSRVVRLLTFPLVGWLVFVATPFALYFSGWYPASLADDTLHNLTHLHFLLGSLLFFMPLIGVDPLPHRVSYPLRLLILFSVLPFHAFLGIAVMSDGTLLAASHYLTVEGQTYAGALADQRFGGGLLWSSGDLLGLVFLTALLAQWMRADEREAVRTDRRLDRADAAAARRAAALESSPVGAPGPVEPVGAGAPGAQREDAELAAFNARLAALHRRTAAPERPSD